MKILFISKIEPLPVDGGEKIRSFGLLYCLQKLGHDVSVITRGVDLNSPDRALIDKVNFIVHSFSLLSLSFPFVRDRKLIKIIDELLGQGRVDLVILDYQYLGQYISWFKKRGIPVIYGTHNAQADLDFQRVARRPLLMKLPQLIYAGLSFLHERTYFKKADVVWMTSPEDAAYHHPFVPDEKVMELPNFLVAEKYTQSSATDKGDYIAITANFTSFQNVAGAEWFFKNIWDSELANKTRLLLVGKGSDSVLAECRRKGFFTENTAATGAVQSVNEYVAAAKVSLVPLLHGSGTRLKIIEALALKTPVISTTVGATGIKEGVVSVADSPAEFKTAIQSALTGRGPDPQAAYQAFVQNYSSDSASKIIERSIATALPVRG